MKIVVASLTLRFYERDGWKIENIRSYLVNKKYKIVYRHDNLFPEISYFAVYDESGYKIWKKELLKHEFENKFKIDYENWYIED